MRRRLREYKKEKRMWCRYVAGAMAFIMLVASAPVTSAFGLENEEEEQATILTYKETDEGMVVDQFIPTEEAQTSWEEGFQEAKAELEVEGYGNVTDASDENNMVYAGGEDYVVPVIYVADEEKDSIPLEAYDGKGGEHYLWKCISAEKMQTNSISTEKIIRDYFWIRSEKRILINSWNELDKLEIVNNVLEPQANDAHLEVHDEDKESTNEKTKVEMTVSEKKDVCNSDIEKQGGKSALEQVFDTNPQNFIIPGYIVDYENSNNINASVNGNVFIGWNPQEGKGDPTNRVGGGTAVSGAELGSKALVSMKSSWRIRFKSYIGNLDKNGQTLENRIDLVSTEGGYLATLVAHNKEKSYVAMFNQTKIVADVTGDMPEVAGQGWFGNGRVVEMAYKYDSNTEKGTFRIVNPDTLGNTKQPEAIFTITEKNKRMRIRYGTTARWYAPPSDVGYPKDKVVSEFELMQYDNFNPEIMSAKWYDSSGNELSKSSDIKECEKITVIVTVNNNSTEKDEFDAHLKLSDDESQAYMNGIDVTGNGLDGDGTAVTLTNREQENTFVVTATRDSTAGELALGIMMEDDFFHEKQYMQLYLGEQYGVTYDSNLSSLDPAVNADAVTVPEVARVPIGDSFTVGNVSAAQIDSTDGTTRYEFTGWNTEADGSGYPYAAGASMTPTGAATLYAQWRNATLCPLTLDVSDNSVKDKLGTLVADISTAHDGYAYDPATGAVRIDERLFGGACNAPDGHVHTLTITGTKSDAGGLVTIGTSGTSAAAYNVSVEGVTAPGMVIQSNGGSVTFNGTNLLGGGTDLNGLKLDLNGGSVTLADGSAVTAYTKASDGFALKDSGKTLKSLNLTMANQNTQDVGIQVAGVDKNLPAGTVKIAFLDKKDGTWLTTSAESMKVQNADGSVDYVSGATEASYKKTFELGADGVGTYTDVRLPSKLKQISLTVPTRVVFNIYTKGKDGTDHGFIGPEYELKNTSYTTEDYYQGKEFGSKTYQPVDVGFGGITAREKSQYQLADYKTADEGVLNETITDFNTKPLVCIQAVGNGTKEGRVNLDESAGSASTDWFKAVAATGDGEGQAGISKIKLTIPKEYTGSDSKRWYQDVEAVSKEGHVYRGYHTMKLNFTLP